MKRITKYMLFTVLVFNLCGCSAMNASVLNQDNKLEETIPTGNKDNNTDLSDNLQDYQIMMNDALYEFPMWYSDFEAMGWKDTVRKDDFTIDSGVETLTVCEKDGMSITVFLKNFSEGTVNENECEVIGLDIGKTSLSDTDKIILPGGINCFEKSYEQLKEIYGTPTKEEPMDEGGMITYEDENESRVVFVAHRDGEVISVSITNRVELKK